MCVWALGCTSPALLLDWLTQILECKAITDIFSIQVMVILKGNVPHNYMSCAYLNMLKSARKLLEKFPRSAYIHTYKLG